MESGHGISWGWWVLAWMVTALAVWLIWRLLTGKGAEKDP